MTVLNKRENLLLFLGDLFFFIFSLWLMLFIRYHELPSSEAFLQHLVPFSVLFLVWIIVFFIAGLYDKHTVILQGKLPGIIFNAQLVNTVLAFLFFYFIPYFGITPKTNLFIYLIISFGLLFFWRIYCQSLFGFKQKENAILIGSGDEMKELKEEVNNNPRYNLNFISSVDLNEMSGLDFNEEVLKIIYSEDVHVVAVDLKNEKVLPILPSLYNLIFSKIKFIDMYRVYEDIFDRVPLSLVRYNWFLENISTAPKATYDFLKRAMDIVLSLALGVISLVIYPFVIIAIKLEDRGPIFFVQERVGKNNKIVRIRKFRSMTVHKESDGLAKDVRVTKVGAFLRKSRVDELPQLWNVLRGDISLIGPRPELPVLVKLYEKKIPYYDIRHLIKPGLSGWAQLNQPVPPKFSANYDETKIKLSYDLYYIKNRSFLLDLKIALKTIKALLSRSGM